MRRCWKPVLMFAVVGAAPIAAGVGCQVALPEQKVSPAVHAQSDVAVNHEQMRLRMRALVVPLCGQVEAAADQIIAGSRDRRVQREALRWKIEAVPALRAALFQPRPATALGDAWVLCFQMKEYFEKGAGKTALGESAPAAVSTCLNMEEQIRTIAAAMTISGDMSQTRAYAQKWAAEHPIRDSIAHRESILSRATELDVPGSLSAGEVVMDVAITLDDLNRRLDIYSDQLFRQARWEAEWIASDLLAELPVDKSLAMAERAVGAVEKAVATLDRLAPTLERTTRTLEELPKVVATERLAATKSLQEEMIRALAFAQAERVVAFEEIQRERVASLKELHEAVTAERKAFTEDAEVLSLKVVDHAIWRVAQLVAAVCVLALFAGIGGMFLAQRLFSK